MNLNIRLLPAQTFHIQTPLDTPVEKLLEILTDWWSLNRPVQVFHLETGRWLHLPSTLGENQVLEGETLVLVKLKEPEKET